MGYCEAREEAFLDHLREHGSLPAADLKPYHVAEWIDDKTTWGPTYKGGAIVAVTPELATISNSVISGNNASSTTTTGSARVQGGGIQNGGLLELRNTTVSDNTGTASGSSGVAQGGGIWNSTLLDEVPTGQLTLRDTAVTHNALYGGVGITLQGGGLFTTFPVTLKDSFIAGNTPDQCYGC